MMDKIEARSKWLKANGKAPHYLGKHQRVILARAKSKADVKMDATTNKPSDVDGHRPPRKDPDSALSKRARCDTHDEEVDDLVRGVCPGDNESWLY